MIKIISDPNLDADDAKCQAGSYVPSLLDSGSFKIETVYPNYRGTAADGDTRLVRGEGVTSRPREVMKFTANPVTSSQLPLIHINSSLSLAVKHETAHNKIPISFFFHIEHGAPPRVKRRCCKNSQRRTEQSRTNGHCCTDEQTPKLLTGLQLRFPALFSFPQVFNSGSPLNTIQVKIAGVVALCYCQFTDPLLSASGGCARDEYWVLMGRLTVKGPNAGQSWSLSTHTVFHLEYFGFGLSDQNILRIISGDGKCSDNNRNPDKGAFEYHPFQHHIPHIWRRAPGDSWKKPPMSC